MLVSMYNYGIIRVRVLWNKNKQGRTRMNKSEQEGKVRNKNEQVGTRKEGNCARTTKKSVMEKNNKELCEINHENSEELCENSKEAINCETGNCTKGRNISEVEIIILVWISVERISSTRGSARSSKT